MSNDNIFYVVIRCAKSGEFDAIQEIEKILTHSGRAWFGKYGQPLSYKVIDFIKIKKPKVVVVLATKKLADGESGYHARAYEFVQTSKSPPKDASSYPSYYAKNIRMINTWIKLQPLANPKINLGSLVIKSSLSPLVESLAKSRRGHFFCYRR